jgi:hypothetical protein
MAIGPATSNAGPAAPPTPQNPAAQRLADVARIAYDTYSHDCSHSIWFVLKQIVDPNQPYMVADQLMASVKRPGSGWRQVQLAEASDLANRGVVVLGGLEKKGHGHVVVVMPGPWHAAGGFSGLPEQGSYPPSMSGSMSSWQGARSRGERTVRDPWGAGDWPQVTFWTKQ